MNDFQFNSEYNRGKQFDSVVVILNSRVQIAYSQELVKNECNHSVSRLTSFPQSDLGELGKGSEVSLQDSDYLDS